MMSHARNPLTYVWAFLTLATVISWWIGHGHDAADEANAAITLSVLLLAAFKTLLVIRYFMEVRFAPAWLKLTTYGVVAITFALMVTFYSVRSSI